MTKPYSLDLRERVAAAVRSCPNPWCSFVGVITAISGWAGIDQAAISGRLTRGLSLRLAMVSRLK